MGEGSPAWKEQAVNGTQEHKNGEYRENCSLGDDFRRSNSVPDSLSAERSCTPPVQTEFPQPNFMEEKFSQMFVHPRNGSQLELSGLPGQPAYPYYMPGVVNQVMMPPSTHMYQRNMHEMHNHTASAMLHQFSHFQQCPPHVGGMPSFPYYPVGICLQPGQVPTGHHAWPSFGGSSSTEVKANKVDRREAALIKFRQKRKERCFDKKIRYVNRKRLAERRPRVRGQFVRKGDGVNVDLNGQPSADYDDEEEDDEEQALENSSPEDDTSGY